MSLTKSSAAFDRMMEEARIQEEHSYLLYAEEQYLRQRIENTTNDEQTEYEPNNQQQHGTRDKQQQGQRRNIP